MPGPDLRSADREDRLVRPKPLVADPTGFANTRTRLTLTDPGPFRGGAVTTADGFISAHPTPDGQVHVLIRRSGGDAGIFLTREQARELARLMGGV